VKRSSRRARTAILCGLHLRTDITEGPRFSKKEGSAGGRGVVAREGGLFERTRWLKVPPAARRESLGLRLVRRRSHRPFLERGRLPAVFRPIEGEPTATASRFKLSAAGRHGRFFNGGILRHHARKEPSEPEGSVLPGLELTDAFVLDTGEDLAGLGE